MEPGFHAFEREVEDWHWWYRVRREILATLVGRLNLPDDARILDLGCGTGGNSLALAPYGHVVGVDRTPGALRLAAARPYRARALADGLALPFLEGSFDLVVALDILEHLDDDVGGARELGRVLRPGRPLVVFVPALQVLWSYNDDYSHHRRRYGRRQLGEALTAAGLVVERVSFFNTVLFAPILATRLAARILGVTSQYEHQSARRGRANDLAAALFGLEAPWLRRRDLPIGVSLLAVARRPADAPPATL
ncbi:MAG TPA: methyltransferase domain-containing protein [Polyangia bacterium]|jgi:SAM-dependent methyltransferase